MHALDIAPPDRAVQQSHVPALGANLSGSLVVSAIIGIEIRFVLDDRAARGMGGQNPLKTIGVNVQVCEQDEGGIRACVLR